MRVMKTLNKTMKRKGVTMKRFYANFPLCCPSRTTLLTGQYAHNHKVLSNQEPDGGYGVFNELHGSNNLAIWMQDAGYTTSYIGKFLNEYAEPDEYGTLPTDVPKGWTDWRVLAPSNAQYFGYTLNENGVLNQYGEEEEDYSTDVFTNKAKRFIRRSAPGIDPFFLMLGYAAPHGGGGGSPGRSLQPRRGPGAPPPRDAEGQAEGLSARVVQRRRRQRQAHPGRRARSADPRPGQRHAAQAPLRMGVAAGRRRERRRDPRRDQARRRTPQHLRVLPLRQRLHARRAQDPQQQALPLRNVGAGAVRRPRARDRPPAKLRRRGHQRRPGADDLRADGRRPPARAGRRVDHADPPQPGHREREGDRARGLRGRSDHRPAHLPLPLHRMGHRPGAAGDRALRHLHRPLRAQQPRPQPQLCGGRR